MKNFIIGLFVSSNIKKFAKIIKHCPDHWEYSKVPQEQLDEVSQDIEASYVLTHVAGLCGFSYFIRKNGSRHVAFIGPTGNVIPVTRTMDSIYMCDTIEHYLSMPDEELMPSNVSPMTQEHASL